MRILSLLLLIAASTILTACARYSVSLNDNEVYAPPSLFTNYAIGDTALAVCVDYSLREIEATSSDNLLLLNCSNAGIVTTDGLEIFSRLEQLSLSDNRLTNIDPLLQLVHLTYLDLRGNEEIDCEVATQLQENIEGTVFVPAHCT